MATKFYGVVFAQQSACSRHLSVYVCSHYGHCLVADGLQQSLVFTMNLRLQSKLLVYGVVAKVVVEMSMSSHEVHRLQVVCSDIVYYGLSLFGIESSTVHNHTFLSFVAHNIAVFLQHIASEFLYIQHRLIYVIVLIVACMPRISL